MMQVFAGGVCAAKGFRASGIHCGVRKNHAKKDLALIVSDVPAAAAAVYTQNLVQGAPIAVTREHLKNGTAQAVICNSGNANTCNQNGVAVATAMCELVAQHTPVAAQDVIVASTGVIGQPLDITPIRAGMQRLAGALDASGEDAAEAILTTDTAKKQAAARFTAGGKTCTIGGMAKGSGMIHPNMATMLVFLTCDAAIAPELLQKTIAADAQRTFNMISVDGDTSTNDMLCILCNGRAGNAPIQEGTADYDAFCEALHAVTVTLCRAIAKDGEGATKLLECRVSGGDTWETAATAAKAVICSTLFKAAMFGADANWGRVLCAVGYSGAPVDVSRIDVSFTSAAGTVRVCAGGTGVPFDEALAKRVLSQDEITVELALNLGACAATAYGCDLTYDYVKINGDYRT